METAPRLQRFFVSGQPFELWEDPDRPFHCTPRELERYVDEKRWVLLFNALALPALPLQAE